MVDADDFQQFVEQVKAAVNQFVMSDPEPMKAVWSHADDVTIFGGFGSYAKGREQISSHTDWASARFCEGYLTYETLAMEVSGDLAYSVWIEKGQARVVGREELSPVAVRVTHVYRREEGIWKLIHRHGDTIIEKIKATAVLQK